VRIEVPEELDGERADRIVAILGRISRSIAGEMCERGEVEVSGGPVQGRERLAAGTVVEFEIPEALSLTAAPVPFDVLYEDRDLIVVDKPPGVVVHPGAGTRSPTLAAGLLHRYPELEGVGDPDRWGIVHRLDRDTSGVLIVARNEPAHSALREAIARREVSRHYLTLVRAVLDVPSGTVDAPIGVDPRRPDRRAVVAGGRAARTNYVVIRTWDDPGVSLLEVSLETGRTHQIRVHLAAIGAPVVGDKTYGKPGPKVPRIFLHACRVELEHPTGGETLTVESPLPWDLESVLESLG